MTRSVVTEETIVHSRRGRPRPEDGPRPGAEPKTLKAGEGGKAEETGTAMLPCADMTCPCRVLRKR